jgi:transposase InsO family protein
MYMPYTTNPHLPRLRMQIAKLVINDGWSTREASRYSGYNQSTVVRWVQGARMSNRQSIPTKSSRPHHHPDALPSRIVRRIVAMRLERDQCAEVLRHRLSLEGTNISLSSVKRVIKRYDMAYPSPWKKWHKYLPRPLPEKPGILVEIDSMWHGIHRGLCAYAVLDVCSRWAYAEATAKINAQVSFKVVRNFLTTVPFQPQMLQSDHGSEFAKWFSKQLVSRGISHRHTRIRKPTDNGHVERFIRTLQQECLSRTSGSFVSWKKAIPEFIHYYNNERPHMGLNMRTPAEVMRSY